MRILCKIMTYKIEHRALPRAKTLLLKFAYSTSCKRIFIIHKSESVIYRDGKDYILQPKSQK